MKSLAPWARALAALAFALVVWDSALAQQSALPDVDRDGGSDAGTDAGVDEAADADEPTAAASDAKRVVRIRRVITLDKQRIAWLKGELRSRTRWFEDLAAAMEEVGRERNAARDELEALEADPDGLHGTEGRGCAHCRAHPDGATGPLPRSSADSPGACSRR